LSPLEAAKRERRISSAGGLLVLRLSLLSKVSAMEPSSATSAKPLFVDGFVIQPFTISVTSIRTNWLVSFFST
jgi:hypothetical protein